MDTIEVNVVEIAPIVQVTVLEPNSIIALQETTESEIQNPDSTESGKYVSVRRFWQGIAKFLSKVNVFTKQQYFAIATLTDAASIAWDLDNNQVAQVTLAGNRTLANPTNLKNGATYILHILQDGTGSRNLAYGTNYKFPNGVVPVLTATANAVDILTCVARNNVLYCVLSKDFR